MENELANSIEGGEGDGDEDEEEEEETLPMILDDDFTTHGLERLSSAATCLVAGVEYTHGQQIYRKDPCEFCLCLDGEMFCWWQDCPPALEGPCKDRGPFSPCTSVPANPQLSAVSTIPQPESTTSKRNKINSSSNKTSNSNITSNATTQVVQTQSSTNEMDATTSLGSLTEYTASTEHQSETFSSEIPELITVKLSKHCTVMGKEYQIGDKLPHNTGNCIECICDSGAKVTCSPHQCAPGGVDPNEYIIPGLASQQAQDLF